MCISFHEDRVVSMQVRDEDVTRPIIEVCDFAEIEQKLPVHQNSRMPGMLRCRRRDIASGSKNRDAHEVSYRPLAAAGHSELYLALTCSSQLFARPWPFKNGRAASTNCGARPIS